MTDNEIIKALECCTDDEKGITQCAVCPYHMIADEDSCVDDLLHQSLNLINRQKAENERLNKQLVFEIESAYDRGTKAAVKEFAEELIKQYSTELDEYYGEIVWVDDIENLVKEKVGDIDV